MFFEFIQSDPIVRVPIYIGIGLCTECLFTAISDLISPSFLGKPKAEKRDLRATGYTFLWMIPIYALLVLMEPLIAIVAPLPWILRGFIYMVLIFGVEFASGAVLQKLIGHCPWDYSYNRFSIKGWIRLDFAPFWFAFGLCIEALAPKLIDLTPYLRIVF